MAGHACHRILVGLQCSYPGRSVYLRIICYHTLIHAVECKESALWIPESSFLDTELITVYALSTKYTFRFIGHLETVYIYIVAYRTGQITACCM